jgi:hypothetical protein
VPEDSYGIKGLNWLRAAAQLLIREVRKERKEFLREVQNGI